MPKKVEFIIFEMKKQGHRADIVGGCVRDFCLGKEPDDYDLTTSAAPKETKSVFKNYHTVDTGIKHGTVTLMLDGEPFEITTYRIDGEYTDNRHPSSVTFSKRIEDDLSRRDFTMNAIAYNPYDGLTDPFGGVSDIKSGIIRSVGDAARRFDEDALRILRGIRFASTLGFKIESDTSRAIIEKRELLANVSAERIFVEWKKLLSGNGAFGVLEGYLSVISVFFPEIKDISKIPENAFLKMSAEERNITLFYYNAPDSFSSAMKRLKTDNLTASFGKNVIDCLLSLEEGRAVYSDADIGFLLKDFGEETVLAALRLANLLGICDEAPLCHAKKLLSDGFPYRLRDLAVSGNDLISVGIKGSAIGEALDALLDRVILAEVENNKEALLSSI